MSKARLLKKGFKKIISSDEAKELADNNHLLVETDKEYAEKTREHSFKRNADVQRLSTKIRELEESLQPLSKKLKSAFTN